MFIATLSKYAYIMLQNWYEHWIITLTESTFIRITLVKVRISNLIEITYHFLKAKILNMLIINYIKMLESLYRIMKSFFK